MDHIKKLAEDLGISYEEAAIIIDESYASNIKNYDYEPDYEPIKKNIISEFTSEDIQQIIDIDNIDVKNILLNILLQETLKKESGKQYSLNMNYCIGLANDKYNDKLKKIQELINKEQQNKQEPKQIIEETSSSETLEERRARIRDSWSKKL